MKSYEIKNKNILIFGGTGSLGKSLIKYYLNSGNNVTCFSRDEAKHWTLKNTFKSDKLTFIVGDIRDKNRVQQSLKIAKPNIIIIAAALKQVDTCELSPEESIKTNIIGIQNIVNVIEENQNQLDNLEKVLMVSTDKACSPINVYGMCKSIAERVVLEKNRKTTNNIDFIAVRYGNVLESRGSIIPLFLHQAKNNKTITLTHEVMTRFLMTLDESVDLINYAIINAERGDTYIPKLKSMKIIDLAEIFSIKFDKKVEIIGIRPGEKIHESMINETESLRLLEEEDHFVIKPIYNSAVLNLNTFDYTSKDNNLTKKELEDYLISINVFAKDQNEFVGKSIEEIRTSSLTSVEGRSS
tara:strand:+ start:562 stop:1626 length:1065 start_codon:yes stop_codon:yes gene_type:complete